MNWPNEILIRFLDNNGQAVCGLLVFILLKSKLKNDFSVEPLVTDTSGTITLLRSELVRNIESSKAQYPMDYHGSLEDCSKLEIIVEENAELEDRVIRLEKYYPENAKQISLLMTKCVNAKFRHEQGMFETPINEELILNLTVC